MTELLRSPTPVLVTTAEDTVEAGQAVEVTVRLVADRELALSGGEVELVRHGAVAHFERGWMGAGGTVSFRRSAALDRADLEVAEPLARGQRIVRRVTLTVPPGEATVAGYLIQQEYTVRARIRIDRGRGLEGATTLRVTSTAAERSRIADEAPTVDDAGFAVLGIEELCSRRLNGGVPLSGVVTVTPLRAGSARGVRIELVLDECVPARGEVPLEEDRTRRTVVAVVPLADRVDLAPVQMLRWPFTVRSPLPLPAPSLSTPEFTLRWLLRVVLDRPVRSDPTTTLELWGTTAP
jgi:hypothetical protein